MAKEYTSSWWAIELPLSWSAEQEKDCVSLSADNGVGALQISAYRRDGEPVTDEDLSEFAKDELIEGVIPEDIACGDFRGITTSEVKGEDFWRKLWLRSGALLLYVTYNCAAGDRAVEAASVNRMLSSLKSRVRGEA